MTRPRKLTQHCRRISTLRDRQTEALTVSSKSDPEEDCVENDECVINEDFPSNGNPVRSVEEALRWVDQTYCRSRAPYIGFSERTCRRKRAEKKRRANQARGNSKITAFFSVDIRNTSESEPEPAVSE